MKTIWHRIKGRPWLASAVLLMVILVVGIAVTRGKQAPPATTTVQTGDIVEEISVTGKTKPTEEIDLAFEKSGRVVRLGAKVGDRVSPGQMVVQLDQAELAAQLAQAQASVMRESARLDQLERGARKEDLAIKQAELDKAKQDLENEYASAYDVLQDAFAKADDAVRKQTDTLYIDDETSYVRLAFTVADTSKQVDMERARMKATESLNAWRSQLDKLTQSSDRAVLDEAMQNATNHLYGFRDFLSDLMATVQGTYNLSAEVSTAYKTSLSTARTEVSGAITAVSAQKQAISSQLLIVQRIENELALKLAGTPAEEIDAQRASLRQAEANVASIQAQLGKSVLRSPIRGVVTAQEAKVGQIITPNAKVVSIISENQFEIETNIPEADIQKLKVGDPAIITLDAYGSATEFEGVVVKIDPAETMIEGVVTYKATMQFTKADERIKSGMTANIDIRTNERKGVLVIPQRSVITEGSERFAYVYAGTDTEPEKRKITVGLRGTDGNLEVLSGLQLNEVILRIPPTE